MGRENLILDLFNDVKSADITFVVDQEEIHVHKAIFASECSYFHTMFVEDRNEANATRIALSETPVKQFKELIRFCYLKRVNISGWRADDVCNLLRLAHEHNFDSLMEETANQMGKCFLIHTVSLPVFYDLAVTLNSAPVLYEIKMYIIYFNVESKEFVKYSADLVRFILSVIQVDPKCIKALWKWKDSHTDQEVEQVFKSIRWENVPSYILAEVIRVLIVQANLSQVTEPTEVVNLDESEPCPCCLGYYH